MREPEEVSGSAPEAEESGLIGRASRRNAARLRQDRWMIRVGRLGVLTLLISLWAFASRRFDLMSDPLAVLQALFRLVGSGEIWAHLLQTSLEVALGYGLGASLAIALALVVGIGKFAYRILRPFLLAAYAVPKIALAPLVIMWFGLGTAPKVLLAATFVFFVVFMSTLTGVENVNVGLIRMARVMGASRAVLLWKIVLPSATPQMLSGLRLAIPEALIGAVAGEILAATRGLGYLVSAAAAQLSLSVSLAAVLVLLLLLVVADRALLAIEARFLGWQAR
ncbi:MAG: ABC transporter permease [Vicinamibacteria bacterium]